MSATAPRLRTDLTIIERAYRGETTYVVKDIAAHKYFRFGAAEMSVMRQLDGRRSLAAIAAAGAQLSESVIERFVRTLSSAGLLERSLAEKSVVQLERLRSERRRRIRRPLFRGELLRMRWSLGDPDALLERAVPRMGWMFTSWFAAASIALFAIYLIVIARQWTEFTAAVQATYSPHNLTLARVITFWITAGVVILIHELGHGAACKHFGGEVRELGFMILYFQPAFYCNVNDAWSFPERRARLWVTAAGPWIELIVTAFATLIWCAVEPGTLIANVMVATMLIGGVTTLLANANPLLPLDGYFALTDWLEIPNLRHRAFAHVAWWFKRHVFRLEIPEPAATPRERRVFLTYGALASTYISVMFGFLALIALGWGRRTFGVIGVVAGVTALFLLLRPGLVEFARVAVLAIRARRAAWRNSPRRPRMLVAVGVLVVISLLPWTLTTSGTFVIRPPMSSTVSAPDSGVVAQVFVSEGMRVEAASPLIRLVDRDLERRLLAAVRVVDSCAIAEQAARAANRSADAERAALDARAAAAQLAALDARLRQLTVRAMAPGIVVTPRPEELVGRRVSAGDSLLTIASLDSVEARVSLGSGGATRVRPGQVVHLISYADVGAPWTSRIEGVSVAGTTERQVEARVRRVAAAGWRPGATGEARVELERSIVLGMLWWKARQLIRGDLWL